MTDSKEKPLFAFGVIADTLTENSTKNSLGVALLHGVENYELQTFL